MKTSQALLLIVSGSALLLAMYATVLQSKRVSVPAEPSIDSAQKIDELEARLARMSERLDVFEQRLDSANAPPTNLPLAAQAPRTASDELVVYDAEAKLRIGRDVVVSSPTGVMVSDLAQTTIVGDLTIESPTGTLETNEALVETVDDAAHVKATTLSFTPKRAEEEK